MREGFKVLVLLLGPFSFDPSLGIALLYQLGLGVFFFFSNCHFSYRAF